MGQCALEVGWSVTEQNTSPHRRSIQVPGVLPVACLALPAVLVVAQGMETQSVVQEVSPTVTSPGELGLEREKLSEIV